MSGAITIAGRQRLFRVPENHTSCAQILWPYFSKSPKTIAQWRACTLQDFFCFFLSCCWWCWYRFFLAIHKKSKEQAQTRSWVSSTTSRNPSLDTVPGNRFKRCLSSSARWVQKYSTTWHPWKGKTVLSSSFGLWIWILGELLAGRHRDFRHS